MGVRCSRRRARRHRRLRLAPRCWVPRDPPVEGETIARKILRDDEYAAARPKLAAQIGEALAALHRIPVDAVPDLEQADQVVQYRDVLDCPRRAASRHSSSDCAGWTQNRPPSEQTTVVHGDFRLGNLIVGPDGLRAVLDWELAHLGDPIEDLGWLCVRAWRFGESQPVGGFGDYDELFGAYAAASGTAVDPDVVRWWEILGTLKWGVMCIMQASAHLGGWQPFGRARRHRSPRVRERARPLGATAMISAFPGHAGRVWPLLRWRSVARSSVRAR